MKAPENVIADLLRQGLTTRQIREQTRADYGRIADIRRTHAITVVRTIPSRTVDETLALYTETHDDGHLCWTGPMRGRTPLLHAEGARHNARHVSFRRYYRRDPVGYVCTTCPVAGCLAGAHLADELTRQPNRGAVIAQLIESGTSNWEIVRRLGTSNSAITRARLSLSNPKGQAR